MLGFYNISLQGSSHKASGKECQDSSNIVMLENGWIVSVIADGLGSARCSDVGSSNAVQTIINYLQNHLLIEWNVEMIYDVLREAYISAKDSIANISQSSDISIREYDTTLTTAVYNGKQIVYAHVGDGGIVQILDDGRFAQLTLAQKGEEFNSVEPLRNEKAWAFGSSDENVCAFAMFTDGVYDVVCPWILASEEQKIYVNYVRLFMDMNVIKAESEEDFILLKENAKNFLLSDYNSNITDDKTVAVVVNTDIIPPLQSEEYYIEPNWEALKRKNDDKLYSQELITE